jgi:AcrR family transcriptional regulator
MSAPDQTPARRGRPGYDREQILEIAVSVFIEQGYDATSVASLAERLGLSKSALYHHFASKEALLEVALVDKLAYVTLLLRVRGNSDVERAALERRRAFDRRVTRLVRDAQAEGTVRSDIDPSVATRLLFGMVNSIVEWYRPAGAESAADLARDVLAVALDGIVGPK